MPLQKIGVEAVVENLPGFDKAMSAIQKMTDQTASSVQKSAASTEQYGRVLDSSADTVRYWKEGLARAEQTMARFDAKRLAGVNVSQQEIDQYIKAARQADSYSNALSHITEGTTTATAASSGMSGAMLGLGVAIAGITVAVGAAVSAINTLSDLMQRGAGFTGIIESFNILAATSKASSQHLLDDMHDAAAGAISDMELMKKANLAFTGVSEKVAEEFSTSLPTILKFARLEAQATGESFDYLYDSLVKGIKRSSVRVIDNAGLVLRVSEANKQYADSVGKTVDQLTAQETQMALMRATVAAAAEQIELLGGVNETAEIKVARLNATMENTLNSLATAVQPLYNALLDSIQPIFSFFQNLAESVAPYVQALAEMLGYAVEQMLGPLGAALEAINTDDVARGFFVGGARIIGSLAGGMAAAAQKYVLPVIQAIAELIASFLSGFSPPPQGPLHTIDIGGANVMRAWLEGFTSVGMEDVSMVAAEVASIMGDIAGASREYVNARLKELDAAIQPFKDKLDLIRASFDALKPATDAAFSAIDRQMEKSLLALNAGVQGSADMVRALDSQKQALEDYVDAQQQVIDNAQIQLSLAESQQAVERVSLGIRLRMLGPEPKETPDKTAKKPAAKKPKKAGGGGGGGGEDTAGGGRGATSTEQMAQQVSDFAKKQSAMADMAGAFEDAFTGAGGDMPGLQAGIDKLKGTGGDIKKSLDNLGTKIQDAFKNAFSPEGVESLRGPIGTFIDGVVKIMLDWLGQKLRDLVGGVIRDAFTHPNIGPIRIELPDISSSLDSMETALQLIVPLAANLVSVGVGPIAAAFGDVLKTVALGLPEGDPVAQLLIGMDGWLQAGGVNYLLTTGLAAIRDAVADMIQKGPINWLVGAGVGIFQWAFDTVIQQVVDYINGPLKPVITSIGKSIAEFISDPLSAIGTAIMSAVAKGLRAVLKAIKATPLINIFPQLGAAVNAFDEALKILGGATGGTFTKGLLRVGERGEELIAPASKIAVFPNSVVRALDMMESLMARPMPAMALAGNVTYNQQRNNQMGDINMYGVRDTNDAIRRYSLMMATRKM